MFLQLQLVFFYNILDSYEFLILDPRAFIKTEKISSNYHCRFYELFN